MITAETAHPSQADSKLLTRGTPCPQQCMNAIRRLGAKLLPKMLCAHQPSGAIVGRKWGRGCSIGD